MKKTKLLMPLAGVAALGAVTPVIMAATSCNKNTTVELKDIEVEDTVTGRVIWSEISRDELKVTAKYSNNTSKEVTNWTSENFDDEGKHRFNDWTDTITINYAEGNKIVTKEMTFNLKAPSTVKFGLKDYFLNMGKRTIDGTDYAVTTSKQLDVVGGYTGIVIPTSNFTFTSDKTSVVTVGEHTGIVTTVGAGTAKITAKWTDQETMSSKEFYCNVTVNDDTTGGTLFDHVEFDTETKSADFGIYDSIGQGTNSDIVTVPREITLTAAGAAYAGTYKVTGIYTGGVITTPYSNITTIILPNTVTDIPSRTFVNGSLTHIYYNGTKEDLAGVTQGRNWYGSQAVGVQCLDGFVNFTNRCNSEIKTESTYTIGAYLEGTDTFRSLLGTTCTVQFELSEFPSGWVIDNKTQIRFFSEGLLTASLVAVTNVAVYIDGELATSGTDYSYDGNGKITFIPTGSLSTTSTVTVQFRTPLAQFSKVHVVASSFKEA